MARRVLDDGRWFDSEKADSWEEGSRFDGNNNISLATGSQWVHEMLYRTASGRWILHRWSQWQGSGEGYAEIGDEEAARWLVRNEHAAPKHAATAEAFAALEVT